MTQPSTGSSNWAASNRRNTLQLLWWTAAWVLTMALAAFGPRFGWSFATVPTILGVLLNLAVGFGMIAANRRYLNGLDEMHQKIFLDAAAITLGVGLVFGLSYGLLEDIQLITYEPEISHLTILMCITFMIGMLAGHRKLQ